MYKFPLGIKFDVYLYAPFYFQGLIQCKNTISVTIFFLHFESF